MSITLLNESAFVKHYNTQAEYYAWPMKNTRPETRKTISRNLRYLRMKAGWSERQLSQKSGVAQKTINNILNEQSGCKVETADALAGAFGLSGWQLLMPSLPDDLIGSPSLRRLFETYVKASPEGREIIEKLAQREADYGRRKDAS